MSPLDTAATPTDFTDNVDTLDLRAFGFTQVTDVLALATSFGNAGIRIDFGSGDRLLLQNYSGTVASLADDILV